MDQNPENFEFSKNPVKNVKAPMSANKIGEISNRCSQCYFTFANVSNLRLHLKIHSGEKNNKCKQCDFASTQAVVDRPTQLICISDLYLLSWRW